MSDPLKFKVNSNPVFPPISFLGTEPKKIHINQQEAIENLLTIQTDEIHAAALIILGRLLFSEPIQLEETIKEGEINKEAEKEEGETIKGYVRPNLSIMQEIVKKRYIPLLQNDVLEQMFALGYVAISAAVIETDEEFNDKTIVCPTVLHPSTYKIEGEMFQNGFIRYYAVFNGQAEPAPNVYLYMFPFSKPDPFTGAHKCVVSRTRAHAQHIQQLYAFHILAQKQLSYPPVIFEPLPPSQLESKGIGLEDGPALFNQQAERAQLTIDAQQTAFITQTIQKSLITQQDEDLLNTSTNNEQEKKKFKPTTEGNPFFVPVGFKVGGQAPSPTPQQNLTDFFMEYIEILFSFFGIPVSYYHSTSRKSGQGGGNAPIAEQDNENFSRVLGFLRNILNEVLEFMYIVTIKVYNNVKHAKSDITFHLNMIPFSTSRTIQLLFEQGVLAKEHYEDYILKLNGFTPRHKSSKGEAQQNKMRIPINGNEHQTIQSMEDAANIRKEEIAKLKAETEEIKERTKDGSKEDKEIEMMEMEMQHEREKHQMEMEMLKAKLEFEREKLKIDIEKSQLQIKAAEQSNLIAEKKGEIDLEIAEDKFKFDKKRNREAVKKTTTNKKN